MFPKSRRAHHLPNRPQSLNAVFLQPEALEEAYTLPSAFYTEPDFFRWDQETILAETWQMVGHQGQIKEVGQVFSVEVGGNPVFVIRTASDELKAFYNVCQHRGGPIIQNKQNSTEPVQYQHLRCGYHGWTYDLDGALKGIPEFEGVQGFDASCFGLKPVQVHLWQGLIFVNLSQNPVPFDSVFGGIQERIAPIDMSQLEFYGRTTYELDCNWKVYVDNYVEGYHINQVHPELAQLVDYKQYTTELFPYYSLQYSPLRESDNVYGDGVGEVFYYFVYPNLMLNIMPNRLQANLIVPISQDKTCVIFDYYYKDCHSEKAQKVIKDDWAYSELVQQQDITICEQVQKGLASRAYDQGRFSMKRESGVHHFQDLIRTSYRKALEHLPETVSSNGCKT
jgi:choline monooxygenase